MSQFTFNKANHPATVLAALNEQRRRNEKCDIILEAQGEQFPVHSCVMAITSYFNQLLERNNELIGVARFEVEGVNRIEVEEVDRSTMRDVLNFLYSGKITITRHNFLKLLEVSKKMKIEGLLEFVEQYMIKVLNESNCYDFRDIAYCEELNSLKMKSNEFLTEHITSLSEQTRFLELFCVDIRILLEDDSLNIKNEEVAFELLLKWVEAKRRDRKDYFYSLFKLIRLHYISSDYLSDKIKTHELVMDSSEPRDAIEEILQQRKTTYNYPKKKPRKHYVTVVEQKLGLENKEIPDHDVTASSMYDSFHAPYLGRLNNYKTETGIGAWVAQARGERFGSPGSNWIQIHFSSPCIVTAIITQGRPADYNQYVTSYLIKYSNDGSNFVDIGLTFTGNNDTITPVTNRLPYSIIASFIRLHPMSWHKAPTLRMEVLGFHQNATPLITLPSGINVEYGLGIESKQIPDLSITASSMWDSAHGPYLGRLNNHKSEKGIGAWVPKKVGGYFSPAGTDWIQVQFPLQCTVTAIVTQGRPADYIQYVKSYNIKYSNDGVKFHDVGQTFTANCDVSTQVTNRLPKPIVATYIRLYPMSYQEAPTLRMEIIGFVNPNQYLKVPAPSARKERVLLLNENKVFISANRSWNQLTHIQGLGWIKQGCAIATNQSAVIFCGGLLSGKRQNLHRHPSGDASIEILEHRVKNKLSNQVMEFDGKNWKTFPPMAVRRCGAVAAYVQNRLFVFGGETSDDTVAQLVSSYEEYQGKEWKVKGHLLEPRSFGSIQVVENKAYMFGGYNSPSFLQTNHPDRYRRDYISPSALSSCEIYDPDNNSISRFCAMNEARANFGSALIGTTIYVVGGVNGRDNVQSMEYIDTVGHDDRWTTINLLEVDRFLGEITACNLGKKILIHSQSSNIVYEFNTVTKYWNTDYQPPPQSGFLVTVLR